MNVPTHDHRPRPGAAEWPGPHPAARRAVLVLMVALLGSAGVLTLTGLRQAPLNTLTTQLPEASTELYFSQYDAQGTRLPPGQSTPVPFTLVSHEATTVTYRVEVTVTAGSERATTVLRPRLQPGQTLRHAIPIRLRAGQTGSVTVRVTTPLGVQFIHTRFTS